MHTHLRLREQNLAGPPAKFVRTASYDSALIKRLKLERLLNGHGEGKAGPYPRLVLVHVYIGTLKAWQLCFRLVQARQLQVMCIIRRFCADGCVNTVSFSPGGELLVSGEEIHEQLPLSQALSIFIRQDLPGSLLETA